MRSKILKLSAICLPIVIAFWLLLPVLALGQCSCEKFVSPNGSNSNSGGFADPWKTVSHALEQEFDALNIMPGTYSNFNATITRSGTITNPRVIRAVGPVIVTGNANEHRIEVEGNHIHFEGSGLITMTNQTIRTTRGITVTGLQVEGINWWNTNEPPIVLRNVISSTFSDLRFDTVQAKTVGKDLHAIVVGDVSHGVTIEAIECLDVSADCVQVGTHADGSSDIVIRNSLMGVCRNPDGTLCNSDLQNAWGNTSENAIDLKASVLDHTIIDNVTCYGYHHLVVGQNIDGNVPAPGMCIFVHDQANNVSISHLNCFDSERCVHFGGDGQAMRIVDSYLSASHTGIQTADPNDVLIDNVISIAPNPLLLGDRKSTVTNNTFVGFGITAKDGITATNNHCVVGFDEDVC